MDGIQPQPKHKLSRSNILRFVDTYYESVLNCETGALRARDTYGWKVRPAARSEDDPITQYFGMRQVVYLLAPYLEDSKEDMEEAGPTGVAVLAEELLEDIGDLLDKAKPDRFFSPEWLLELDNIVRATMKQPLAPGCEPLLDVYYASPSEPTHPYVGPWQDWIERLDERMEHDPFAVALLARHGGGVFVVRIRGSIVAYIGLRSYSDDVWELTHPRLTASAQTHLVASPDSLMDALILRATHATIKAGLIPVCAITARDGAIQRSLRAAGYHRYAQASVYATTVS